MYEPKGLASVSPLYVTMTTGVDNNHNNSNNNNINDFNIIIINNKYINK